VSHESRQDGEALGSGRRRHTPIRIWRYDEGYGQAPGTRSDEQRQRWHRRSGPLRWLRSGPQGELLELLSLLPRRYPIPCLLLAAAGLWLAWPSLSDRISAGEQKVGAPDVITVFVEDPQRTIAAMELWKDRPNSLLVMQGDAGHLAISLRALKLRNLMPEGRDRIVSLTRGCDTVGQLTTLAQFLSKQPTPGTLTVVTSPAHLDRSLAIARIVLGRWQVDGMPAETGDNRPESSWRLWRDQARAQVWRLTGWDGNDDGIACRTKARGLG
jgi:uncharacterized SAM-binding protein YcdF (DUF218 family)